MKKKYFILLLTLINVISATAFSYPDKNTVGAALSSVTTVDMNEGRIMGERAEYYFDIPQLWRRYITANKEQPTKRSKYLDKINFYYPSQKTLTKPAFLMSLFVYDRKNFSLPSEQRKLIETNKYVFTISSATINTQTKQPDIAYFDLFLKQVADDEFLKEYVKVPSDQKIIMSNSITVNGKQIPGTAISDENNAVHLPIRDVCVALGYKVNWLANDKAISISKPDFYRLLLTTDKIPNQSFTALVVDDKAYASSIFFIQILKTNVEIDENMNIYVTE